MLRFLKRCLIGAAPLFFAVAWGDATPSPSRPEALDVYYEAVRNFLAVLPAEYDPEEATKPPSWGNIGPLPSVAVRVGRGGPYMELDARDGTVYYFQDLSPLYSGQGAEEPMDTVLSADEAFALARCVLQYYKLPLDAAEYDVLPSRSVPADVSHGRWEITRDLSYQGMESLKSRVMVAVRAYTKRVEIVEYSPPVPPAPVKNGISRAEAVERAREVVTKRESWPFEGVQNFEFGECAEVTKIIAMPWEYPKRKPHEHPYHSRYFWKVPYSAEFRDYGAESWQRLWTYELIDVETGKEIGEINAP